MKILLIAPAAGPWRTIGRRRLFNGKTFRFSMLSLLTVAASSPKDAEVTLIDEQVDDIPDEAFDLVGVTVMTALAPRAYAIADQFRARGIPVVLGGFHVTLNPDEAVEHADAIVVGPAQGAWQQLCRDVAAQTLQRIYYGDPNAPAPAQLPRHLLESGRYLTVSSIAATAGCMNRCRFCSISAFHKGCQYVRPVEEVVAEAAALEERFFLFVDDNLTQNREYAIALFRALKPLRKRWAAQASVTAAQDDALLDAMSDAGCVGVFMGIETFDADTLEGQEKGFNAPAHYRKAVSAFHRRGMFVEAGMIVGFDRDDPGVFRRTLTMLESLRIDAIQLSILTPLPGTPLFEEMRGRIRDLNWEHYDFRHVVYAPAGMSATELQTGADWLIAKFYSPWRILKRVPRWLFMRRGRARWWYPLGLNLAYLGRVRRFGIGSDAKEPAPAGRRLAESVA